MNRTVNVFDGPSPRMVINMGNYSNTVNGESSDWAVACVIVYQRHLSNEEIENVENSLIQIYKLPL